MQRALSPHPTQPKGKSILDSGGLSLSSGTSPKWTSKNQNRTQNKQEACIQQLPSFYV